MKSAREAIMKNNENFKKELDKLREQLQETREHEQKLEEKNIKLQDEIDSLWAQLDEIKKSDIENWSDIIEQIKEETLIQTLMESKNKIEA